MTVLERLKAAGYDPVKAITHHLTAGTGEMESIELGVAQSTACDSIRHGLEALAEIWPDVSKSCA